MHLQASYLFTTYDLRNVPSELREMATSYVSEISDFSRNVIITPAGAHISIQPVHKPAHICIQGCDILGHYP